MKITFVKTRKSNVLNVSAFSENSERLKAVYYFREKVPY